MSDPNALPIAGWYPDPENEAGDRWWNGATWSDHRRPRNAGPGWAPEGAKKPAKKSAKKTAEPEAASDSPAVPVPPASAATTTAAPYTGAPAQLPPAYQPYAPAYAPNYAPATSQIRNQPAFAGMLVSLIGLLFNWILWGAPGIVGAIISFVGLRRAAQLQREGVTVGNGRAMAIGGIVAGLAGALLFDLFYFSVWSPLMFR
ncbi:MAG TPA: DUF2510 domain-containing protein [Pseudolysinimonas sp.]|nr:DUF2510 domain-containing protein [Pseudolysinimonas sp.]